MSREAAERVRRALAEGCYPGWDDVRALLRESDRLRAELAETRAELDREQAAADQRISDLRAEHEHAAARSRRHHHVLGRIHAEQGAELDKTQEAGDALAGELSTLLQRDWAPDYVKWVRGLVSAWWSVRGSVPAPDRAGDDEPRTCTCGEPTAAGVVHHVEAQCRTVEELRAGGGVTAGQDEPDDQFGTSCTECLDPLDDDHPYGTTAAGDFVHYACCDEDAAPADDTAAPGDDERPLYEMQVPPPPPAHVTAVQPTRWSDGPWRRNGDEWVRGRERRTWAELMWMYNSRGRGVEPAQAAGSVSPDQDGDTSAREPIRGLLARSSLGCPNTPRCGALLSEHAVDDWDGNGDPVNPRCPDQDGDTDA